MPIKSPPSSIILLQCVHNTPEGIEFELVASLP